MQTEFIAVTGATASGKSALAVELAKRLDGEIVSCDSMQIYKGMNIGTAKPASCEMQGITHHMIDTVEPDEDFSAGDFAHLAGGIIKDIKRRGKAPIMCGGTFLYLDTMTSVASLSDAVKDENLRRELELFAGENGNAALHARLEAVDPEAAGKVHENNVKRVVRALEIFYTTGKTKTEWDRMSKMSAPEFSAKKIVIDYDDRNILYERIDRRVDIMMEEGLEGEVRHFYERGLLRGKYCAAQAIGYKEFVPYFEGEKTLDEVVSEIKQSTRNYAKRQLTWLRRYKDAIVLKADENGSVKSAHALADEAIAALGSCVI